jgi:hypothetical protein
MLLTSSNIALVNTLQKGKMVNNIFSTFKVFIVRDLEDLTKLAKILRKYISILNTLNHDLCLITPPLGPAHYLAQLLNAFVITNSIFILVKRKRAKAPDKVDELLNDMKSYVAIMLKELKYLLKSHNNIELEYYVYYDYETMWRILLDFIPIIISSRYDTLMNNAKCKDVELLQFLGYPVLVEENKELPANTHIVSPVEGRESPNYYCNPLLCINPKASSKYTFNDEVELVEKAFNYLHKHTSKLYIEYWSSLIQFLHKDNYTYVWLFEASEEKIIQLAKLLAPLAKTLRVVTIITTHNTVAELGSVSSRRTWISPIIIELQKINNKVNVTFI